jgi:hypothetical protein
MPTLFLLLFLMPVGNGQSNSPEVYTPVSYCELVGHPMEYDGKRIAVRATCLLAYEVQVILSLKCRNLTYLSFEAETPKADRVLQKQIHRDGGTFNATFYGTFHKEMLSKTFSVHGSYQFDLQYMEDVKIIAKKMRWVEDLSKMEQQKLCEGDEVANVRKKW